MALSSLARFAGGAMLGIVISGSMPHLAFAQAVLSVTCQGIEGDVVLLNNAVAALGTGGGEVYVQPGTCFFGPNETVNLFSAVWLRGAGSGPGGTVFFQPGFSVQPVIQANTSSTMTDVTISDLAIEGSDIKALSVVAGAPTSAGGNTILIAGDVTDIGPQMAVIDTTNPGAIPSNTQVAQTPVNGQTVTLSAAVVANGVKSGDQILFYPRSATIDAEWINGLTINNVHVVKTASMDAIVLQGDTDFVISNNFVSVTSPDPLATGTILLTARSADNPPWNHAGFLVGNVLLNASIEVGGTNVVVSNNVITPGYGTGIVSEAPAPWSPTPISAHNVFENNVVHFSQGGMNHDGIVAGGLEIWDTQSLVADNEAFDNGGQGILIGGPGTRVAGNRIWDNGTSPIYGNSGLDVQTATAVDDVIVANFICNTGSAFQAGVAPVCLSSQNSGSQQYSLYVDTSVSGLQISADNQFLPGHANASGTLGNYTPSTGVSEGVISATSCVLANLQSKCQSSIQWSSLNATNVNVLVSSSASPGTWQTFASGASGSSTAPWLGNGIYVFELVSDQGVLASTTVQPSVANAAATPMATAISPLAASLAPGGATQSATMVSAPTATISASPLQLDLTAHASAQVETAVPSRAVGQEGSSAALAPIATATPQFVATITIVTRSATAMPAIMSANPALPQPQLTADGSGQVEAVESSRAANQGETSTDARDQFASFASASHLATPSSAQVVAASAVASAASGMTQCGTAYQIVTASADRAVLKSTSGADTGTELVTALGGTVPSCGRVYAIGVVAQKWIVTTEKGVIH